MPSVAAAAVPLLDVHGLSVSFPVENGGRARAVDSASLSLHAGRTLAVVGESGSGKSVTALSILRLLPAPPHATIDAGRVAFEGRDLLKLSARDMLDVRGGGIAMIFQEPMTSLNPVYTIGEQIFEAIRRHHSVTLRAAREMVSASLREVGIEDPHLRRHAYPHQFSGGMRQRVMIAMALACNPRVLLADEPTTALDVTVAAQILDLLGRLQRSRGLAIMLITHDLGIVKQRADDVCVMFRGRVVESGNVQAVLERPLHPYTRALLECRPRLGHRCERLRTISEASKAPRSGSEAGGVHPWWPGAGPEASREVRMCELEPGHFVACAA